MAFTRSQARDRDRQRTVLDRGTQVQGKKVCKTKPKRQLRSPKQLDLTHTPSSQGSPTKQALQPPCQPPTSRKRQETPEHQEDQAPKRSRHSRHTVSVDDAEDLARISYWTQEQRWPRDDARDTTMDRAKPLKKLPSSRNLRQSLTDSVNSATPTDQTTRDGKTASYRGVRYEVRLEQNGSFMHQSRQGVDQESRDLCRTLLENVQATPSDSLFSDEMFEVTCKSVRRKNEQRVIRDINPLIAPSAEILANRGSARLECLIESTNERWNNAIPLTGTRPQPDYSVGFRRGAFSETQLQKLSPLVHDCVAGDPSLYMGNFQMYLPFFTCEVKCGDAGLNTADSQNSHSMTLAVRAVVQLFRQVGREMELHRQIQAFSISHDDESVRIYGHYPEIRGEDTMYYRHTIHKFVFAEPGGKERWTAYQFTRNVYDIWMPGHLKKICSAIDELPSPLDSDGLSLSN